MQCVSCRFENMPGINVCGRCGSPLGLSAIAIDVHPPRAGAWTKRLRRWLPFRGAYFEVRDASRDLVRQSGIREAYRLELPGTFAGAFGRAIVPGWPHYYLGHPLRGRFVLVAYLALIFLALLLFGTTLGMFLAGLAFAIHVASCVSVLHLGGLRRGAYWSGVATACLVLAFGIYVPIGWLVSRAVSPAELNQGGIPFEAGDVLLYSPAYYSFHQPKTGDVVIYDHPGGSFPLPPPQHGYIRIAPGQRIDRILAGPGDRILWDKGQLTVNGEPSSLQPLNPSADVPRLTLDVPPGCYLILPTAGPAIPPAVTQSDWSALIVVPRQSIRGPVFFRSFPFTRMQRIS